MFKKPFTQKTQSKVRSSDRRQLWQQIAAAYGQDWAVAAIPPAEQPPVPADAPSPSETAPTNSAADDGLASQLSELTTATAPPGSDGQPSQAQLIDVALSRDLKAAKFVTHVDDMGILYFDEHDQPLWFRTQLLPPPITSSLRPAKAAAGPRTIIAPTVYTLWKFPTLLPKVYTHVPVLEHLVSGADLMLPGVIRPPYAPVDASLQPGQIVTVAVRNAGTEGPDTPVAVGYLALSGSEILQSAPRAKGKAVHILHTYMDYVWQHGDKSDPPLVTMPTGEYEAGVDHQTADDDDIGQTMQNAAPAEATSTNEAAQSVRPDLTTEEIDTWFQRCLLQTLVVDLPADRLAPLLPLSTSTLHSAHMIPNQPADIPLDIKKSSYKKLSKFFKVMDKKGLLKVKELKGGEMLLLSVNRQAKELTTFEPLRKSKLIGAVKHQAQSQGDAAAKGGEGDRAAAGQGMISISDVYRPRTAMVNFLIGIGIT
ncbi:hypothetical protein IWQ60_001368 [Tieghemiomyces parasiticus]|uniref:Eukaryotic translation initiation factor 2D n=1 Tax=Tieghemiomyces parasiticus TaxID=78921 RepID=A0A9W8AJF9_9FUNG|nr:hypothetical protein IWQ60_001368 [Tieghemiomyces parasiticus]